MVDTPEVQAAKIIGEKSLPPEINTEDQVINYLEGLYQALEGKRVRCFVKFPHDKVTTQREQSKAFVVFNIHYGSVLGSLAMAAALGKVSERFYREFHSKTLSLYAGIATGVG